MVAPHSAPRASTATSSAAPAHAPSSALRSTASAVPTCRSSRASACAASSGHPPTAAAAPSERGLCHAPCVQAHTPVQPLRKSCLGCLAVVRGRPCMPHDAGALLAHGLRGRADFCIRPEARTPSTPAPHAASGSAARLLQRAGHRPVRPLAASAPRVGPTLRGPSAPARPSARRARARCPAASRARGHRRARARRHHRRRPARPLPAGCARPPAPPARAAPRVEPMRGTPPPLPPPPPFTTHQRAPGAQATIMCTGPRFHHTP